MKRSIILPLAFIILAGSGTSLHAQQRKKQPARKPLLEHTLLWEISGNGLTTPSYLYGTMHVYDRRAFDFSDSVLLKFQQCRAFASEVVFDDALRDAIRYYMAQDSARNARVAEMPEVEATEPASTDQADPSDEEATSEISIARTEEATEPATIAEPREETSESYSPPRYRTLPNALFERDESWRPGDSPVVVDAYFYRLAKKERKKIIGLETADEQLDVLNYNDPVETLRFYLRNRKKKRKISERDIEKLMLEHYRRGDVEKLHELMEENLPPTLYRRMIVDRNRVMAERGEEHIHRDPTFIAVGAGHLGGKEGLIELFRERGYTVRPVRAVYTGLAKKYREPEYQEEWKRFSSATGAYSVELPAEPISISQLSVMTGDEPSADSTIYIWPDVGSGIIYSARHTDNVHETDFSDEPGSIQTRAEYLEAYGEEMQGTPIPVTAHGLEGRDVTVVMESGKIRRMRYLSRGNRLHILRAETVPEVVTSKDIDRFFNSFRPQEFGPTPMTPYTSDEGKFSVMIPAEPEVTLDTIFYYFDRIDRNFTSADRNSGGFFQIQHLQYSEHFQATDEEAFFQSLIDDEHEFASDTTARMEALTVQGFPARDIEYVNAQTGFMRRSRIILHGDQAYVLRLSAPRQQISSENYRKFFDSFRILSDSASGNIYSDKTGRMLEDLKSPDADIRGRAGRALYIADISPEYYPALHALLRNLSAEDAGYEDAQAYLLEKFVLLRDSSAVPVIREVYLGLPESSELRVRMLTSLAGIGTGEATLLFKELILQNTPELAGEYANPFASFHGNVEAYRLLYPEILSLLDREDYRTTIYWATSDALDSGAVTTADLAPYAPIITAHLRSAIEEETRRNEEEEEEYVPVYPLYSVLRCARSLPETPELQEMFRKLLDHEAHYIVAEALLGLVGQEKKVPAETIRKVAANPEVRVHLYQGLERLGRLDLFPAAYGTQKSIAESHLVNWLRYDYEYAPDEIEFLEERRVTVNGTEGRAFLFKFKYNDWEKKWRVGISGLQPTDATKLAFTYDVTRSAYRTLEEKSIDEHFDELLETVPVSEN